MNPHYLKMDEILEKDSSGLQEKEMQKLSPLSSKDNSITFYLINNIQETLERCRIKRILDLPASK
jgi:hypothetical protein